MRNSGSDCDQRGTDRANGKVREYVNPAVYVETTLEMGKDDYIPGSGDHPKTIKRCVCFTNPKECPCHPYCEQQNKDEGVISASTVSQDEQVSASRSLLEDSDSGITVKAPSLSSTCDLRLSIPSQSNLSTVRQVDNQSREENFRLWCIKKDQERKLLEEKEALISRVKEQRREAQTQLERENFRRWLSIKKKEEEEKKKMMAELMAQEELRKDEQEKKIAGNEEHFQNWLKRKEEQLLEKRSREQSLLLRQEEQRKQRLEYSARAYELWLQQSKNKQKPVPFSQGLDTLKSSASVAYINPIPWVPNIDRKPNSQ